MIVDTSALLAIVLGEEDAETYLRALLKEPAAIAAPTLTEALIVAEARQGHEAVLDLEHLLQQAAIDVIALDPATARGSFEAWRRFGKGRHPAGLNFGDCFSYALAHARSETLLFKGDDFAATDVAAALGL